MAVTICSVRGSLASTRIRRGGTIVTIGDYVDKGPDSRQVIERLLPGIAAGWKLVALKGNHDAMMVDALRNPSKMASWLEKGGDAALASYGGDPAAIPQSHLAWLDGLRLMHVDDHRLYVHAGVDPEVPLDQQSERRCCGSAIRKGSPAASADVTSFMVMITLLMARCCTKAVPISIRSPGAPDGW